jgi:hypothetical protein
VILIKNFINVNSLPKCTGLKSHQAVPVLVPDAELYDRFKEYTKWKKQNVTVVFDHNNVFAQVLQRVLQRHLLAPLPFHARQNSLRYPDLAGKKHKIKHLEREFLALFFYKYMVDNITYV